MDADLTTILHVLAAQSPLSLFLIWQWWQMRKDYKSLVDRTIQSSDDRADAIIKVLHEIKGEGA